jgi:hypothetical protein
MSKWRSEMVKITVEVPEALVGDIYLAVGKVLQLGQDELEQAAAERKKDEDDEPANDA